MKNSASFIVCYEIKEKQASNPLNIIGVINIEFSDTNEIPSLLTNHIKTTHKPFHYKFLSISKL